MFRLILAFLLIAVVTVPATAQEADPDDVATPDAIVRAGYDAISHAPGESFDWERFRSLFLPDAKLIPNLEQSGGNLMVMSPQEFTDYIDSVSNLNAENYQGFVEEVIVNEVFRYGDIAHVTSSYQKRFWESDDILGRGINSFQLLHNDGRWWIVSVIWDEDVGAGPLPEAFMGQ